MRGLGRCRPSSRSIHVTKYKCLVNLENSTKSSIFCQSWPLFERSGDHVGDRGAICSWRDATWGADIIRCLPSVSEIHKKIINVSLEVIWGRSLRMFRVVFLVFWSPRNLIEKSCFFHLLQESIKTKNKSIHLYEQADAL